MERNERRSTSNRGGADLLPVVEIRVRVDPFYEVEEAACGWWNEIWGAGMKVKIPMAAKNAA